MAADKLVDSTQLDADLTSVANAIRTKGGTSAQMAFPAGFVSAVQAIPTGGSLDVDGLADRTIPQGAIEFDSATVIFHYQFENCSNIVSINGGTVEEIRENAFINCAGLEEVNFPNLSVLWNGSQQNTNANGMFFMSCSKLKKVHFPELLNVYGNYAFASCGTGTESGMTVVLPKIVNLGVRAFRQCKCADVDLGPNLAGILADTLYNGTYGNLILRGQNIVPISNTNAISSIKDVYVPGSLIETYKTSTNWSTKYDAGTLTFHAIEGSQYENYYADGTPIT